MWRHFDYECRKCKSVFEEMISDDAVILPCPSCHEESDRLISTPSIDWRHMGTDPGFPGAYSKWGKEQTAHHKNDKGMLHGGKAPNLSMY